MKIRITYLQRHMIGRGNIITVENSIVIINPHLMGNDGRMYGYTENQNLVAIHLTSILKLEKVD